MTKLLLLLLAFFSLQGYGQVSFSSWTNAYMQINSYNGATNPDALTMTFAGNGNFTIPHWRIGVKLLQPISSENGQYTLPAQKVSFQPVSSNGQAYPNAVPTITEIGAPLHVFLQLQSEVFLIPQSNAPLYNAPAQPNGYYNLQLKYAVTLHEGSYLGAFPAWTRFFAPVELISYDKFNTVIGKTTHVFEFHIGNITDAPPVLQELSLRINMGASNGVLEFTSALDYNNGVSVTYNNGLEARCSTEFQIKVKSQGDLRSSINNTIPISVVYLSLVAASGSSQSNGATLPLSLFNQIMASGSSSNGNWYRYDVKYFTLAQDERLINAKSDQYVATLQYEITPQ